MSVCKTQIDIQIVGVFSNTAQRRPIPSKVLLFQPLCDLSTFCMNRALIQQQQISEKQNVHSFCIFNTLYHLMVAYFSCCTIGQILNKRVLKRQYLLL